MFTKTKFCFLLALHFGDDFIAALFLPWPRLSEGRIMQWFLIVLQKRVSYHFHSYKKKYLGQNKFYGQVQPQCGRNQWGYKLFSQGDIHIHRSIVWSVKCTKQRYLNHSHLNLSNSVATEILRFMKCLLSGFERSFFKFDPYIYSTNNY